MANPSIAEEPRSGGKRSVFLVDDHPLLRQGLTLLINQEQDLEVIGEAEDAQTALQAISNRRPAMMIVDISLNGEDGLDLLKKIRTFYGALPVLILSMHDEAIYAERALRAGANGYIMKQQATEEVLVAMRRILSGGVYLSDRMSNNMLQQYVGGAPASATSRISNLSDRELEVFGLVGEGRATREIANQLRLSVKTIETYQAHIKEKLFLRSGRELIQQAIQWRSGDRAI
jgi:DNA-binding NarL/FixJ family response regulator